MRTGFERGKPRQDPTKHQSESRRYSHILNPAKGQEVEPDGEEGSERRKDVAPTQPEDPSESLAAHILPAPNPPSPISQTQGKMW